jgi:hypothetical protein
MSESYGTEDLGEQPYRSSNDDWAGQDEPDEEGAEYEQEPPNLDDAIDRH